jgi:hypothetical protein
MGLDCPASPEAIKAADEFIARFLQSDRPDELLADAKNPVPKPVPALLLHAWSQALLQRKDESYVQSLERLYGFIQNAQQAQWVPIRELPRPVEMVGK